MSERNTGSYDDALYKSMYTLLYHAHAHWTSIFDLDLWQWLLIPGELWSWPHTYKKSCSKVSRFKR